jgi:hypothetical protein
MLFTRNDLQGHLSICTDNKGASYTTNDKNATKALYRTMIYAMDFGRIETAKSRKDFSLGHLAEGLHNAIMQGTKTATIAFAYQSDYTDQNGESIEIKVSVNSKDLCTPITKPSTVHYLTIYGWVLIEKSVITDLLTSPTDYTDYCKIVEGKGIRLKVNAYKLGTPIVALNKAFGF